MPAHVVKNLALKVLPVSPVGMEHNRARFIAAALAARQQIVPKLGVSAAARCSNVQALIESTEEEESLAPKRHVGTSADDPSRSAPRTRLTHEVRCENNGLVASVKAPKVSKAACASVASAVGRAGPVTAQTEGSANPCLSPLIQSGWTTTSSSVKAMIPPELWRKPVFRARSRPGRGSKTYRTLGNSLTTSCVSLVREALSTTKISSGAIAQPLQGSQAFPQVCGSVPRANY